jgi:hypothetical protein
MLHSLPALLDELEHKLIVGEDPLPLLASVRWQEIIGWPTSKPEAIRLQVRLKNFLLLINALEAPLRVALTRLNRTGSYGMKGGVPLPPTISVRMHHNA